MLKERGSPNQVLTHAARAAAKHPNISGTSGGRARRARPPEVPDCLKSARSVRKHLVR